MNKLLKVIVGIFIGIQFLGISFADTGKFNYSINETIEGINNNIDTNSIISPEGGGETVKTFAFHLIDDIVIPIAIAIGIVMGMIGAYKLLFSSDEKQISTGLKMVVFGIVGIILMVSAKYIGSVLFEDIYNSGNVSGINGVELSKDLYNKIAYPFIKIALYLALAIIFIILVGKSIGFLTKSDGSSPKKALGMIGRCAVSILVIIGAKGIIEAVYGEQNTIFTQATNLGDIGTGIDLINSNIPILFNIISRTIGIIGLIIFLLLIIQGFKILTNPSKTENFQKLGKNLLYTIIGLFVIGLCYILANVFILN